MNQAVSCVSCSWCVDWELGNSSRRTCGISSCGMQARSKREASEEYSCNSYYSQYNNKVWFGGKSIILSFYRPKQRNLLCLTQLVCDSTTTSYLGRELVIYKLVRSVRSVKQRYHKLQDEVGELRVLLLQIFSRATTFVLNTLQDEVSMIN